MVKLSQMTVEETALRFRRGEVTAVALVEEALAAMESVDPQLRAFVSISPDRALQRALELDRKRQQGEEFGVLAGVPVAIKDNLAEAGERLTCGSRILEGYRAPYSATAVERLLAAGAIPVGRTNLDEFSMGSSTENSAWEPTRNPWDLNRVPGGSSGGSAAAVAARIVPLALGSDTGGSIRQPAAFCGVVGLKPTYGRVSRWGLVAFASSLDQIGPLTTSVRDAALALDVLAGPDDRDSTCAPAAGECFLEGIEEGAESLRWGIIEEVELSGCEAGVREGWERALKVAEDLEGSIETVSVPEIQASLEAYYLIATSEASSNLARYDGIRFGSRAKGVFRDWRALAEATRAQGFGPEVKRRILLGTFALSFGYFEAYYGRARRLVEQLRSRFEETWKRVDVVLLPTTPTTAFPLGSRMEDPLTMYLSDVFTTPANLIGAPAISLPVGLDALGLPVGVQLMGPPFAEKQLLKAARALERHFGFGGKPRVCAGSR